MSKNDFVVYINRDVDNKEDYFSLVNANRKELEPRGKKCIYKVPEYINDRDKEAYKPQMVSLGPYHHGEENLRQMEVHKYRALLQFLKRSGKHADPYWNALAEEVNELKDAYDQLDRLWLGDDQKFLEMMIIDGCFILEILRVFTCPENDYAPIDLIFSEHGRLNTLPSIKRDMLLLENQVPLRVLEILVVVEGGYNFMRAGYYNLIERIHRLCDPDTSIQSQSIGLDEINGLHVLDVYRKRLLVEQPRSSKRLESKKHPKDINRRQNTTTEFGNYIIPSATELNETGIRFKTSKTKSLKDISFEGKTLFFKPIVVDGDTKSLFLNLMAFERVHVGIPNDVTSYVYFMRSLIISGKDTSLLRSLDLVRNGLGNDEDVAQLFKSISKGVTLDNKSELSIVYFEVTKLMSDHFRKRLSVWRMYLLENYFKTPWGILSVIIATILFILNLFQTIYTCMSYYHK